MDERDEHPERDERDDSVGGADARDERVADDVPDSPAARPAPRSSRRATARRRLRALPRRARLALALAVALTLAGLVWTVVAVTSDGGDDAAAPPADGDGALPSTTLATGDLDIPVPEGWQPIPLPSLGVGLAVPPGWEAVVLSPDGLASLSDAAPSVPDFVENATAAAGQGGLVYAAGQDVEGRVSDVLVRAAPQTGVADAAGLEAYARTLAAGAGRTNASVEVVDGAARPTVRLDFQVGVGDQVADGTETLVLGPRGIVWSVVVTSDDPAVHDDLVAAIVDTVTLAA